MSDYNETRVLIFSVTYFPFVGGAEVALAEITKRIPDTHFDLITAKISKNLPDTETVDNLTIRRVGNGSRLDKLLYLLRAFFLAKKLNKEKKYNLTWAMLATWAGIAALIFKMFNPKIKYLLTLQSGDSDMFMRLRTWFWYPIYRLVYTKANHIQVISKWLERRARSYGYKGSISLIPNGVDLKKYEQVKFIDKEKIKSKLNIPHGNKVIFSSSRLVEKNDMESLIRSIKQVNISVSLVIAGSGKLDSHLRNLVSELALDQNVIFLGTVSRDQVIDYYAASDIFVRPSLSEGQGISFIEAMAAGVPVIATPVGGIPDFLSDGKTGLFCKVKNPDNLAKKIAILLEDEDLYSKIQKNSLELVRQKYDWDSIAIQMSKIIKNND
jgi:glycosyltransferase involved in cell wall biosynthesis